MAHWIEYLPQTDFDTQQHVVDASDSLDRLAMDIKRIDWQIEDLTKRRQELEKNAGQLASKIYSGNEVCRARNKLRNAMAKRSAPALGK